MKIRYYIDPETKQPHIYNHGVRAKMKLKMYYESRGKIVRVVKDLACL